MPNPYAIDITEIDGFDNMHHAEDILKEAFERTAKLFGAEESLWLINGSSAGLLAAICGATKKNDTVLVARNCHRAVYNARYFTVRYHQVRLNRHSNSMKISVRLLLLRRRMRELYRM